MSSISPFEDYCIVCENQTSSGSLYCSENCRSNDCSAPVDISSPLLKPQESTQIQENQIRDLSYESPLLSSNCHCSELEDEKLDLNSMTVTRSIKDLLSSTSLNYQKWLLSTTIS
ncbi:unnamed protein product [Kuraishia capsulata CBS 1993]|uniref:Uncharacterized protein n=1 Tax=Kuraishia capsulata CBS 1993 TaxID=1382522 RepID=W6MQG5_9ASCO|nr:uncharacterized protein KUCA_T00003480001 [Kuraishia capsulata CBS 1993]CDK27502.1 unnamed protein product [Kuraishia capsulata CBS 1993]